MAAGYVLPPPDSPATGPKGVPLTTVRRRIAVLGSTGSIGTQTLDVVREQPDHLELAALAAGSNRAELLAQASEFGVTALCLAGVPSAPTARDGILLGSDNLIAWLERSQCDLLVSAATGLVGLPVTIRALELGMDVAVANKECVVTAGHLLARAAAKSGAKLLPIDSEHCAVWQCLRAGNPSELRRIVLTASGGPFRGWPRERLASVTPQDALKHPTWRMGPKITVDSATLMNKALELLEAQTLFAVPPQQIEVLVHPQSVVHAVVEFQDGSVVAHMGSPDMRIPIQYALSHPQRWPRQPNAFSLIDIGRLDFEAPNDEVFPSLRLARQVAGQEPSARVVLNAANERCVQLFLDGRIPFLAIFELVERALGKSVIRPLDSVEEVVAEDRLTRKNVDEWI